METDGDRFNRVSIHLATKSHGFSLNSITNVEKEELLNLQIIQRMVESGNLSNFL